MSSHAEARPLIGRFMVTSTCTVEFSPASTSVKYFCELLNRFSDLSVVQAIVRGEYVVISKWNWIRSETSKTGPPVIAIDLSSVSLAAINTRSESCTGETTRRCFNVKNVSAFLRINEATDPFNNTFCVCSDEGEIFAFRGPSLYLYKFLISPGSTMQVSNFRKIKLKTCGNILIHLSMENAEVLQYDPLVPTVISVGSLSPFKVRVTGISDGIIWIIPLKGDDRKLLPLVPGRWGLCEKRRIAVGSLLNIFNVHFAEGILSLCPSQSSVQIDEIPPLTDAVSFHTISSTARDPRCTFHRLNTDSKCKGSETKAFGINSLCICDCFVDCLRQPAVTEIVSDPSMQTGRKGSPSKSPISFRNLFFEALKASEICLSLTGLKDVFLLRAPPFFNASLSAPLNVTLSEPLTPEATKYLEKLPKTLYANLFPPRRPLNSFGIMKLSDDHTCEMRILVSRNNAPVKDTMIIIRQVLVVDSRTDAPVHGIVVNSESIQQQPAVEDNVWVAECGRNPSRDATRRTELVLRLRSLLD